MDKLGSPNVDCRQDGSKLHPKFGRASYLFNSTIAGIDQADAILIVGSNPRREAPVLNARIRKRYLKGDCWIGVVGENADLTYPYAHLGAGVESLTRATERPLEKKTKPLIILGAGAFARADGATVSAVAARSAAAFGAVAEGWNGFNVLQSAASRVAGLDLGLVPGEGGLDALAMAKSGGVDLLINLGADEIDIRARRFRRLHRRARRQGRPSRRRGFARRRLHRKDGHLRQHRGPAAVRRARGVPAGRSSRGLGDSSRAVRGDRRKAAVRFARGSAKGDVRRGRRIWPSLTRSSPPTRARSPILPRSAEAGMRRRSSRRSPTSS